MASRVSTRKPQSTRDVYSFSHTHSHFLSCFLALSLSRSFYNSLSRSSISRFLALSLSRSLAPSLPRSRALARRVITTKTAYKVAVSTRAARKGNGSYKAPMGFYTHTLSLSLTHIHAQWQLQGPPWDSTHTHSLSHTHTYTHAHTHTQTHAYTHTYAHAHSHYSLARSLSLSYDSCSHFRCNSVRWKLLLLCVIYAYVKEPYMQR